MVHPVTKEMYDKAGFEYREKTEELVMMNFDRQTKDKERKYRIDQMYRVKHIDKDYIVYNQTIFATDFPGNEITATEMVGFHDEPQFQKRYDDVSGQPKPVAVAGNVLKYDIPATEQNIKGVLDGSYYKPKREMVEYNTNFVLQNGNAKYGGFTADEFSTKHFDDLLYKATTGFYPRQAKSFEKEVKGEEAVKKEQEEERAEQEKQQKKEKAERASSGGKVEQPSKDVITSSDVMPPSAAGAERQVQRQEMGQEQPERADRDSDQEEGTEGAEEEEGEDQERARTAASNATDQDLEFRQDMGQSKAGRGQRKTTRSSH